MPGITYLTGLSRDAQKRETGSIESEGISGVDPWSQIRTGEFRNSQVFI